MTSRLGTGKSKTFFYSVWAEGIGFASQQPKPEVKKDIDLQLNHLLDVDVDGRDVGVVLAV